MGMNKCQCLILNAKPHIRESLRRYDTAIAITAKVDSRGRERGHESLREEDAFV